MKLIKLSLINIKRQLKNPLILVMGVVFPLIMLNVMYGGRGNIEKNSNIGIINNNNTEISKSLIKELENKNNIEILNNVEEGKNKIEQGDVEAVFVIGKSFGEDIENGKIPKVDMYKLGDENALYRVTNTIDSFIKEKILKEQGIDLKSQNVKVEIETEDGKDINKSVSIILFICYFMIIGGSNIATEMINLKNQKVLKRAISTANTDKEILGSLFIGCATTQIILSLITYITAIKMLKFENITIGLGIIAIILSGLIGTAFISVVVRWIKNTTVAELIIVAVGLVMYMVGTITASRDMLEMPSLIYKIGELSPFTWIARIPSNGQILMPTIILLLMTVVLFTIGSFRLKDFARD